MRERREGCVCFHYVRSKRNQIKKKRPELKKEFDGLNRDQKMKWKFIWERDGPRLRELRSR
jgi:hypothetical protein